jgi:hypothetical protein
MSSYTMVNLKEIEDSAGERAPGIEGRFSRKHLDSEARLTRRATVWWSTQEERLRERRGL